MTKKKRSLTEIGLSQKTDKAYWHGFTDVYEQWLSDYRKSAGAVMEIGIANGSSLKMWKEWFENAQIVGVDILDRSMMNEERIQTAIMDQDSKSSIDRFLSKQSSQFDVIIDDGSHISKHQMTNLEYLWDHLKVGGLYIIEDLHTSYSTKNDQSACWTMETWSKDKAKGPISQHLSPVFKKKIKEEVGNVGWWKRETLALRCWKCRSKPTRQEATCPPIRHPNRYL